MREEDSNWFSRWEEELSSPEELMPLSQTLITHDLALAFDIRNPNHRHQMLPPYSLPSSAAVLHPYMPTSSKFIADSGELGS
ncbi:hypothetical protein like AT3G10760 [Hibiscus trionum]|uniref:Uncharacterized protein n=1 Tax=Hibiscus trionum TaxID=183268 RepID=A0A9W7M9M0_HIBTR|nr:hypothetical protein like AT3G10760 [Hibiscus trionum]